MALVLLALSLAGCAGTSSQPGHTFETVEENGITVATSSAIPKLDGELFAYEKELVIRPDPGNPDSLLYGPRSFTRGDDGRYYVADRGNHRVAVFDAGGAFVSAFGREGQGPGELQAPIWIEARGDQLLVIDDRTTIFRSDGTFVEVVTSARGRMPRPTGDGSIVVEDRIPRTEGEQRFLGARARVVDRAGAILATVETAQIPSGPTLAYGGLASALLTPAGEILATSGVEPAVHWYDLDGSEIRRARIDLPAEAVSAADRAAVEDLWDRLIARVESLGDSTEFLRELKGRVTYPDNKAFWSRPLVDDAGWVWLPMVVADTRISVQGGPIESRQRFRVLDPTGEFMGTTAWPEGAFDPNRSTIVGSRLLTMEWDEETGEILPTVYRIRAAAEELIYP